MSDPATETVAALYFIGDSQPLVLKMTAEHVAARLLDAEKQAEELGLSADRAFARFAGTYGPILVRPGKVACVQTVGREVEEEE